MTDKILNFGEFLKGNVRSCPCERQTDIDMGAMAMKMNDSLSHIATYQGKFTDTYHSLVSAAEEQ